MCPLCAATVIMTVAGSSSAGGVTALAVRKLRRDVRAKAKAEPEHVLTDDRKPESATRL